MRLRGSEKNFISFYEGKGVRLNARIENPTPAPSSVGSTRGEIKGWSKASRRRLRHVLLTSTGPEGTKPFGLTFTIPGVPALSPGESKIVWGNFCREVERLGLVMIWRLEVQERGALHWHAVLWAEDMVPMKPRNKKDQDWHPTKLALFDLWMDALRKAPPVDRPEDPYYGPEGTWKVGISCCCRSAWPGADKWSFDCQDGHGARGAWLRYLQDHATKHKQAQIPEGIGRHWGIVGRSRLKSLLPDHVQELTDRQFKAVVRKMQRLATPMKPCPKAPFGKILGYTLRRGSKGTSVWFSKPETIRRLVEWALVEFPGTAPEED